MGVQGVQGQVLLQGHQLLMEHQVVQGQVRLQGHLQ